MTWNEKRKGWIKKFQGKIYTVSCRQLGTLSSKSASAAAANAWWSKKQAELDNLENLVNQGVKEALFEHVAQEIAKAEEEYPPQTVEQLENILPWGEESRKLAQTIKTQVANFWAEKTGKGVSTDVSRLVDGWLSIKKLKADQGGIHPTRYQAYANEAKIIKAWLAEKPVTRSVEITSPLVTEFFTWLQGQAKWSKPYRKNIWLTFRAIVRYMHQADALPVLPKMLDNKDLKITLDEPVIEVFKLAELRQLLATAKDHSERTYLYLLLMLNCGFYQSDISELTTKTVDLDKGIIRKARSKTAMYKVRYKLWPETLELLKKFANQNPAHRDENGHTLVLVNQNGSPLVPDKQGRIDNIKSAYFNMQRKTGSKLNLPLKALRKTGATYLGRHSVYRYFITHYLANSPRGVEARHYRKPSTKQFFKALAWLHKVIFKKGKTDGSQTSEE
jgi:integrase